MHWGHWTSKDLIHWDYEKAALAPDKDYETGCFSGSAIMDKDGRHLLIYTAHSQHGKGEELFREETQCLAFGDGENYEKYEANPILGSQDMPEGADKGDFRDPKIWFEDGRYYCVMAFVGDSEKAQPLDTGFDYYAPQSMETADGRRIVIGWMQDPESGNCIPEEQKWFGQMSFPREMTVKNGRIFQQPIREIETLYKGTVERTVNAPDDAEVDGISGRCLDMTANVKDASRFTMKFAVKDDIHVSLSYDRKSGYLILDRSNSGRSASICEYRKVKIDAYDDFKLRLLLDRYSFEIFINDGEHVLSGTLYETPMDAEGMTFSSDGRIDIRLNTI